MITMLRRLFCGVGGAAMVVALLLPWARADGSNLNAWELSKPSVVLCVTVAICALTTAATGRRFGVMRPDVSFIGATDAFGVATTVALALLLAYDLPAHASGRPGLLLALASAATTAVAAGDYRPLLGAPIFPRAADQHDSGHRPEMHAEAVGSAR